MKTFGFPAVSLCALLLCLTMTVSGAGAQTGQAAFESRINAAYADTGATDEELIDVVTTTYLEMTAALYSGISGLDRTFILNDSEEFAPCHTYFEQSHRNEFAGEQLHDPEYTVTVNSITTAGNCAEAKATLFFSWRYAQLDFDSGLSVDYTFTLEKVQGAWLIGDIQTNAFEDTQWRLCGYASEEDNCESDSQSFSTNPDDTDFLTPEEMFEYEQSFTAQHASAAGASSVSINRNAVSTYASTYYQNYNSQFPSWEASNTDCQNFASQCIWAGFGGTAPSSSTYSFPMLPNWHMTSGTGGTASWTSCSTFRSNAFRSSGAESGVYGVCWSMPKKTSGNEDVYEDYVSTLEVGDIVHFKWNGNGNQHAMVVVQTTGISGARTPSDIILAGHTTNEYGRSLENKLRLNGYPQYWAIRIMSVYTP